MAMSSYDTLALNEKGKPTNGSMKTPLGVEIEIYKNWVYVRDEQAWREKGGWRKPTVMHLPKGSLTYQDLNIVVLRGPQGGAYVVAWYYKGKKRIVHGMIGCGVIASITRKDLTERTVGVMKSSIAWFRRELKKKEKSDSVMTSYGPGRKVKRKKVFYNFYTHDVPDEFRFMDFSQAVRFNQGDAYFFKNGVGKGTTIATKLGKAKAPMFDGLVKQVFKTPRKRPVKKPASKSEGSNV